ncbi:MAG: hypothetical protein ABW275_11230, partial [Hansschlegelia sp.]
MTAVALPAPLFAKPSIIAELRSRQPALAAFGIACLSLFVVAALLPLVDARMLDGVSVWAKPAKFFLSVGVFSLTSAWFFGFVRPERRRTRPLLWSVRVLIGANVYELGYIVFQAAQGQQSHFNTGDPLHHALYALMGLGAVALILTKLPLAIEIARRPAAGLDPDLRFAVVLGLAMTMALGGLAGVYMGAQTGHSVGAVGGAAPLFGWNRLGGDLRVAHFLGMHAEQILPATGWLLAGVGAPWRRRL